VSSRRLFAMPPKIQRYERDFVGFVDQYVKVGETGKPFALLPFQKEIFDIAFAFDADGTLPWDTFLFSTIKKSGKTALNALVTLWWALTQEAPNELFVLANDMEQAQSRVFAAIAKIIKRNPRLTDAARIETSKIAFANDTTIVALSSDYASAAGSNHGLASFDELWAFVHESSRRLVEEMTSVPTRVNSVRFISTYAGYENESTMLRDLYRAGVGPEEHPDGQGTRIHPTIPLYLNREARLLTYWDHVPRMGWQTPAYYAAQRKTLRPSAYLRLHENQWTTGESTFITPELWDGNVDPEHRPVLPSPAGKPILFLGVDAGIKNDTSAVVGVQWGEGTIELAVHKIWRPSKDNPLDVDETIERYLLELREQYTIRQCYVDPYQLHSTLGRLKKLGMNIEELPQTVANTGKMGEALLSLLKGRNLRLYKSEELREQALNTVAIENTRGVFRIAKEKTSKKIDAIIALAMACLAASEHGPITSGFAVSSFTKRYGMPETSDEVQPLGDGRFRVRGEILYDPRFA
jgi:Terminase large subunit, ATPase domain